MTKADSKIHKLLVYFSTLTLTFHNTTSLLGFFAFLVLVGQLISGIMLAIGFVADTMLIPMTRDEEDLEDLYSGDFSWLHERCLDFLFIFVYCHLFRKLYLLEFELETESAWKSGVVTFLCFLAAVFLGIVISCTHLSEITLVIGVNFLHTAFLFQGSPYWWLFTDCTINTDTILRISLAHYSVAFLMAYLSLLHGLNIHYDWKDDSIDGLGDVELSWWDEVISNELGLLCCLVLLISTCSFSILAEPEALSYEIFTWGEIGVGIDMRFYSVAPHWYFRSFMGWVLACPSHNLGVIVLALFFFTLYFQSVLHSSSDQNNYTYQRLILLASRMDRTSFFSSKSLNKEVNKYYNFTYGIFLGQLLYTSSFLPYGRFFQIVGGNLGLLVAHGYILIYLTFTILRRPLSIEVIFYLPVNIINAFKRSTVLHVANPI